MASVVHAHSGPGRTHLALHGSSKPGGRLDSVTRTVKLLAISVMSGNCPTVKTRLTNDTPALSAAGANTSVPLAWIRGNERNSDGLSTAVTVNVQICPPVRLSSTFDPAVTSNANPSRNTGSPRPPGTSTTSVMLNDALKEDELSCHVPVSERSGGAVGDPRIDE
eukprot:2242126-Rhodomonas_salina.1